MEYTLRVGGWLETSYPIELRHVPKLAEVDLKGVVACPWRVIVTCGTLRPASSLWPYP